jgi:hypothetical protein
MSIGTSAPLIGIPKIPAHYTSPFPFLSLQHQPMATPTNNLLHTNARTTEHVNFPSLPLEILDLIIAFYVDRVGLYPAWHTRAVSRMLSNSLASTML